MLLSRRHRVQCRFVRAFEEGLRLLLLGPRAIRHQPGNIVPAVVVVTGALAQPLFICLYVWLEK
jgi:hypothetical protein